MLERQQVLRSYNELLHRVTAAVLRGAVKESFSLQTILEMVREFGTRHHRVGEIEFALNRAMPRPEA